MGGVLKAQSEPPDFPQAQPSPLFPSICITFSIVSSGLTLHRNIPGSGFLLSARKMEHTHNRTNPPPYISHIPLAVPLYLHNHRFVLHPPHAQNLPVLQDN